MAESGQPRPTTPADTHAPGTTDDLLPLIYAHLRDLAKRRLAREPAGQTLQPTALVHEVFLRLQREHGRLWENERHFLVAAGVAMRRILVDRARARSAGKRGGGRGRLTIEAAETLSPVSGQAPDWLELDDAMAALVERDAGLAEVVHLRYFAGLSIDEAAAALGRSPRSIDRDWKVARAWLLTRISGERDR